MSTFTSFNQFDKRFDNLIKFKNSRNACPMFSLLLVEKFMNDRKTDQESYESVLEKAAQLYDTKNLPKYMSFDELAYYFNYQFFIAGTTPNILGEYGYSNIFLESETDYAIIFLKNSNFITVLVKNDNGNITYHLRDCHEKDQYNFDDFDNLICFLNEIYQFNKMTIVDGVLIEEYANIEYAFFDKPFKANV